MSYALGNPGEPVAKVDSGDLKTFLAEDTKPSSKISRPACSMVLNRKPSASGADTQAVWYRSSMILGAQSTRSRAVGSLDQE